MLPLDLWAVSTPAQAADFSLGQQPEMYTSGNPLTGPVQISFDHRHNKNDKDLPDYPDRFGLGSQRFNSRPRLIEMGK